MPLMLFATCVAFKQLRVTESWVSQSRSPTWISIPVCMTYSAALLENSVLLVTIVKERSLHEPTCIFLCATCCSPLPPCPKTFNVLWSLPTHISSSGCLAQMFSPCSVFVAELAILLAMASDGCIAIYDPLRYAAILTCSVVGKIDVVAFIRSFCIMLPPVFLLGGLPYHGHNVMPHTYCEEHIGVARPACAGISVNIWDGAAAGFLSARLDATSIAVSYGLIFRCLWGLPSPRASPKAPHTCSSHLCAITTFYTPAAFSFLVHRFGQHVPRCVLISLARFCAVAPPMLNPSIYGVRTRQIWEHVAHLLKLGGLGSRAWPRQVGMGNRAGLVMGGVK
ncbi:LOW QUALITY PROTEIN: olfactory receptor 52D1-like [Tyto alba]|uniref:LOW QUALITY PROTEIN: olfactory receptor 52D1-like n=1 Tax=Tyto alba TaxID=56313 RepID=UPI001C66993C|nr:LOW QUALITY PROTEIN: olfactory receptor 52D1-like [Tyto alba]